MTSVRFKRLHHPGLLALILAGILLLFCGGCGAGSHIKSAETDEVITGAYSKLTEIEADSGAIEKAYLDDEGFVSLERMDELLEEVNEYAASLYEEGVITDYRYQSGDTCVYMEIDGWLGCLYDPPLDNVLSGGPASPQIVTLETVHAPLMFALAGFRGPDDTARMIEESNPSFPFSGNYDKDEVTIETVQGLPQNSIVIWAGHGAYNSEFGSALCLGGMAEGSANHQSMLLLHRKELQDKAVLSTMNGGFCVTSKFFENYMPENALSGDVVYLGSCYSYYLATYTGYEDSRLVDSILGLGASVVLGNTYAVNPIYSYKMTDSFFEGWAKPMDGGALRTVEEALACAKEKNGKEDVINKSEVFAKCAEGKESFRLSDMLENVRAEGDHQTYGEYTVRGYYPGGWDCPITFSEAMLEERDVMVREYGSGAGSDGEPMTGYEESSVTFINLAPDCRVTVPPNTHETPYYEEDEYYDPDDPYYSQAVCEGAGNITDSKHYELEWSGSVDGFFSGTASDLLPWEGYYLALRTDQFDTDYCFIVMDPPADGADPDTGAGDPSADNPGVSAGEHAVSVSSGTFHNGVLIDSKLYTWGRNSHGQLGDGTMEDRSESVLVTGLPKIKSICFAEQRSAAIAENGDLYTWGISQLGILYDSYENHVPVKTEGISNVKQVDINGSECIALTEEGDVYTWTEGIDSPQKVNTLSHIKRVGIGSGGRMGAITEDGTLYTWSNQYYANEDGELGRKGLSIYGGVSEFEPGPVESISNVADITFGGGYGAAVTENGALYLWGDPIQNAQVGDGSQSELHEPGLVPEIPPVKEIYLSGSTFAFVTEDGMLFTWGQNEYGSLGLGDAHNVFYPSPKRVPEITGVKEVSMGEEHGLFVTDDNTIYVFGNNSNDQLATDELYYTPVPIPVDFFSYLQK